MTRLKVLVSYGSSQYTGVDLRADRAVIEVGVKKIGKINKPITW